MMTNIGNLDRAVRIVVGLALIASAYGLFGTAYQSVWAWIGVVPLATALIGWCPAYTVFGISTCRT